MITYAILALLASSIRSQASDNISKEEIDFMLDSKMRSSFSLEDMYRGHVRSQIYQARSALNRKEPLSILGFILECKTNHHLLTDYPEQEAHSDFFQSEESFQDYLGDHWRNDETLRTCWYWYYLEAARLFLKVEDFTEAENNLVKMGEIDPNDLRIKLGAFVAGGVQNWNAANQQNLNNKQNFDVSDRYLFLQKYATLYENVRKSQGIKEFDSIDYITLSILRLFGHDNQKGIELGLKALGGTWPSPEDPCFRLQSSPEILKRAMARAYYRLNQFDKVVTFYRDVPKEYRDLDCYLQLSCVFGSAGLWNVSFENFKIFHGLTTNRAGYLFTITEPEAIILVKMLMTRSLKDFNNFGKPFVQNLKRYVPPLENDIDLLFKHIKEKKESESSRLIRRAIAHHHLDSIHGLYQSFDQQYQNLWAHGSLLPSEVNEESLASMDGIAQKIEDDYSVLVTLKAKGSYADNIAKILELSESLKRGIAHFSSQVKDVNHQISKLRRQHHKANLQSTTADNENFIVFKPNLKAQTLAELKQKETERKTREETVLSKKQKRKENRLPLNQAHQEKSKQDVPQKASEKSSCIMQSNLRSFKDKQLQYFWETKESKDYSENVMNMLAAIDKANSIYQLRNYLNPGTKLEILSGDREGQISLRVNDQYRLCFDWISGEGAYNVELIDYHR